MKRPRQRYLVVELPNGTRLSFHECGFAPEGLRTWALRQAVEKFGGTPQAPRRAA